MKCEFEFLPVGNASKAGDAIVVRYGEPTDYRLMLIDGGHAETGDRIVRHLRRHFGPRAALEHVLLTHSDGDHAGGLATVIEQVPVANLWLHNPWMLAEEAWGLFANKDMTADGLRRRVKGEYDIVANVVDLAVQAGCALREPFQGAEIGPFRVLSPSRWAYLHLLPQFDKTPEPDRAAIEAAGMWLGKSSALGRLLEAARAAAQSWTRETWDRERLRDGGVTTASNETSVVLYGSFEKGPALLTGDVGLNGLRWAADFADAHGLPLRRFSFVQVPHHGSRRNVGPTILTRLLGEIQPEDQPSRFSAFVSAPADDSEHPRRIVLRAPNKTIVR